MINIGKILGTNKARKPSVAGSPYLKSNTTNVPDAVIEAMIAACTPPGTKPHPVHIRTASTSYGASGTYTHHKRVSVTLGSIDRRYVQDGRDGAGYLSGIVIGSRGESLLFVLAHELRHAWQSSHLQGKVWGSRGRYSERDADAWALHMLRRARREPELRALIAQVPEGITQERSFEKYNERQVERAAKEAKREALKLDGVPHRLLKLVPPGAKSDGQNLDAPPLHVWSATRTHWLAIDVRADTLAEDVRCGVELCESEDCCTCDEYRDEQKELDGAHSSAYN